jgi:hypothetical protein
VSALFARIEAVCANAVERAFALAFYSALEPVQVARKLVAAFESGTSSRGGRRFVVHIGPADHARLVGELAYLERQWSTMLARLAERSGLPERPPVVAIVRDERVAAGTVSIAVEARAEPQRLSLRVRKGVPADAVVALDRRITIGREPGCDLVLVDSRVSRHHVEIVPEAGVLRLRDTASTNGTLLNGKPVASADIGVGDILRLGDSELVVEAAP